jgi:hypothetical protein
MLTPTATPSFLYKDISVKKEKKDAQEQKDNSISLLACNELSIKHSGSLVTSSEVNRTYIPHV